MASEVLPLSTRHPPVSLGLEVCAWASYIILSRTTTGEGPVHMKSPSWLSNLFRRPQGPAARPASRLALEPLEDRCLLSAGALDPTFGNNGIVSPPAYGVVDMAIYPTAGTANDGKIVTAGFDTSVIYNAFAVARYTSNGSLDSSFGSGGKFSTRVGKYWDTVAATAIQPDGKILVAGDSMFIVNGTLSGHLMQLVRYNANGSLDTTFGSKGVVSFSFTRNSSQESGNVAVQSDGKIDLAGWVAGSPNALALVRFTSNGSLDTTFGSGGSEQIHVNSGGIGEPDNGSRVQLVLQPDGRMVVSGTVTLPTTPGNYDTYAALARVNSNGTLDSSFGNGGEVAAALGSTASQAAGLALQQEGKLVVVGHARNPLFVDMALARFNSNGALDSSFNGTGLLDLDIGVAPYNADLHYHQNALNDVAIQSDGKFVAAGVADGDSYSRFALLRVNGNGSVDSTFGNAGLILTSITSNGDSPNAIALQSDGKIVLGGDGLARYLASAPQIGSFSASPSPVTSGSSLTLTASNISDGNAGTTTTQVAFYVQVNGSNTLLGYGTQSSPGVWSFTFTVSLAPGTYTLLAQAQDSYGVLGDAVALTLQVL
jgi:uncharacterized delta-60 repeat protein